MQERLQCSVWALSLNAAVAASTVFSNSQICKPNVGQAGASSALPQTHLCHNAAPNKAIELEVYKIQSQEDFISSWYNIMYNTNFCSVLLML